MNIDAANNLQDFSPDNVKQLVDAIPVGAMVTDDSGNIVYANTELLEVLGYQEDGLATKNLDSLLPSRFKSGHALLMQDYFKNPQKRQMGAERDLFALHRSGTEIPIEIGLNPIYIQQKLRVLITLIDISPRLGINKMFQRFLGVAPHGVLVADSAGKIRHVNTILCDYFGYSEEELINSPIEMLLPTRYRNKHHGLRASYSAAPDVRLMGAGRDLTALHKDGREFPVEIGLSPFENGVDDKMTLVSLMDITERKRMEMSLKETNDNLEEFTYVASHDLRSPLRGISDLLVWIKEDLGEDIIPSVAKNIGRISVRISKMESLIEDLLKYARAGKEIADATDVHLETMIDNIIDFVEIPNAIKIEKNIKIESIATAPTPLETVLRNLISNAVKHHDKETGKLKIECYPENNLCHFKVCDDGPGIPEASLERIFRLFQTASSSGKNSSGIGLSVSRRLAETHGGRIKAENNIHQEGSTFHLWWPRFIRKDTHD
jgi:PAS domain S-box-containing protein